MDDQVSAVSMTNNVIESDGGGIFLCHGCQGNSASNNVVVLQPAAFCERGPNGVTYATGSMIYNGIARVDLLPSYFPVSLAATSIVVQLSGQASGGTNAAFNVELDGAIIGTGTARSNIAYYIFTVLLIPYQVHRIAIGLTNGVNTGTSTTALNNLAPFVNISAVNLQIRRPSRVHRWEHTCRVVVPNLGVG
jgi:hypothetical protein